ncbi:MAG TPA: thymidine phosphorylase family protein [Burkholderiaceae bacterium]|nr:thymidine phosphorylase family protein [Burkholderiaceae bacterium]
MTSDSANRTAAPSALALRRVGIDTTMENVAFLHRACPLYLTEGFQALAKVELLAGDRSILATLNIVDDESIVGKQEVGLSEPAYARFEVAAGTSVQVSHVTPPASLLALRRKVAGERLERADYHALMRDVAQHRYSAIELAAFVVSTGHFDLDREEVVFLTEGMVAAGRRLDWRERPVVDKHSIGGIAGNRTSMLIVPIVAAHGMLIPKTSSRAITSPAGTADTMECLANVELGFARMQEIVHELRGCLAWGGTSDLAPADDVLISVERPLSLDSPGQMVASILSKKIAAGSTHLVLDIPLGPSAKVRSMPEAQRLRKLFEFVAERLRLTLDVVITDGRQPVGCGIGPMLEARDVMRVLNGDPRAPADLRQKALRLAGRVIEFDADVHGGEGFAIAREILDSGRALAKMNAIIDAQGRRPFDPERPALAPHTFEVAAPTDGFVNAIDNERLVRLARLSGAPKVMGAGVDLLRKVGDTVSRGDPLYRVHAAYASDLRFARDWADQGSGYLVGEPATTPQLAEF